MKTDRICSTVAALPLVCGLVLSGVACSSNKSDSPTPSATRDREVLMQPGVPGRVEARTHNVTANVIAVDKTQRTVTLLGPDNKKVVVKCGPEVKNFDQIKVGQQVKAEVTEQVVVFMATEKPQTPAAEVTMLAVPPKGGKPSAVAANIAQVVATVTAIDTANRKATLTFPDGSTRVITVRPDIDLSKRKIGEQVVIRVTEAVAIAVE